MLDDGHPPNQGRFASNHNDHHKATGLAELLRKRGAPPASWPARRLGFFPLPVGQGRAAVSWG